MDLTAEKILSQSLKARCYQFNQSRRHQPERNAIEAILHEQRQSILEQDNTLTGINAGASAGQTVFHVHIRLIPRRDGDVVDPRGRVRGVILRKQGY